MNLLENETRALASKRALLLKALSLLAKRIKPNCHIQWSISPEIGFTLEFMRIVPGGYLTVTFYPFLLEEELNTMRDILKDIILKDLYPTGSHYCSSKADLLEFIKTRDEQCNNQKKK